MQRLTINDAKPISLEMARDQAVEAAREQLPDPVVMSWRTADGQMAPQLPDVDTEQQWRDHGAANGGVLELEIGEHYRFIIGDATDYERPDRSLINVVDDRGNTYFCVREACTAEDRRRLDPSAIGEEGADD